MHTEICALEPECTSLFVMASLVEKFYRMGAQSMGSETGDDRRRGSVQSISDHQRRGSRKKPRSMTAAMPQTVHGLAGKLGTVFLPRRVRGVLASMHHLQPKLRKVRRSSKEGTAALALSGPCRCVPSGVPKPGCWCHAWDNTG